MLILIFPSASLDQPMRDCATDGQATMPWSVAGHRAASSRPSCVHPGNPRLAEQVGRTRQAPDPVSEIFEKIHCLLRARLDDQHRAIALQDFAHPPQYG